MTSKGKCAEEWVLQAYIDGELKEDMLRQVENHLGQCVSCTNRLVARRERVGDVLRAIALDERPTRVPSRPRRLAVIWTSGVAASLIIALGILGLIRPRGGPEEDAISRQCEWVEVDGENFMPDFESPNKLYRMRAIAFTEFDIEGNTSERYLVKQCNHNDQVN